jgi:hypothetical protein
VEHLKNESLSPIRPLRPSTIAVYSTQKRFTNSLPPVSRVRSLREDPGPKQRATELRTIVALYQNKFMHSMIEPGVNAFLWPPAFSIPTWQGEHVAFGSLEAVD